MTWLEGMGLSVHRLESQIYQSIAKPENALELSYANGVLTWKTMTKHVRVIKEKAQFQACGTNGNQSAGASPRNGQKSVKLCRTSAEN